MVFKRLEFTLVNHGMFENDVKMYGIQTSPYIYALSIEFENDVKMYGIQTMICYENSNGKFENDVKMYGIQTLLPSPLSSLYCLRMM